MPNVEKQDKQIPANLAEMFFASAKKYADREALKYRPGHRYHTLSYGQLKKEVMRLAKALVNLGLKEGDRAVIISENRPEWVISDLAMMCLGVASVPAHDVLSPVQIGKIIAETGPKAIFFSNHNTESKLSGAWEIVSKVPYLISFEKPDGQRTGQILYFKDLIDSQEVDEKEFALLEASAKKLKPDTLASISYTSGTSGHLKGVMLTHDNFIQNIEGIKGSIIGHPEDRLFSILPLSHVFERTAGYYVPICAGSSIGYCVNSAAIAKEMRERKPTVILAAPRFYEKVYEKILSNANSNLIKKYLFRAAFGYRPKRENSSVERLFRKIVFSKIKDIFGGNPRFFISGGARLSEEVGRFFGRAGLVILEGYGLTETSPVIACNRLDKYKFGTVGPVLNNLIVRISDSSEILVKGPSVTRGYLRQNENEGMFTEDGYFRTGDLGYVDQEGFLVINGRSKDMVVLATGKKVIPSIVEEALERSPYIEQAMIVGEGKKHVAALVVPCLKALENKIRVRGMDGLLKDARVRELIAAEALKMTKDFASTERIQKFILLKEPFSMEKGEVTPKLSLRRNVISARYADAINEMYNS
jgi:long-chain acyl-CoA synthetase